MYKRISCRQIIHIVNKKRALIKFFAFFLDPPVIQDFKFDSKLMAGMRTRIYCSIAQGDPPLIIEWLKDGHFLNNTSLNGIKIKELDQYSHSLMIENLSSDHNGNYTCKASNEASSLQHTAQLLVNGKITFLTPLFVYGEIILFLLLFSSSFLEH